MCKPITRKALQNAGFKDGDKVEIEITKKDFIICKPSPNYKKMLEKNPQLAKMVKDLNLIEIL